MKCRISKAMRPGMMPGMALFAALTLAAGASAQAVTHANPGADDIRDIQGPMHIPFPWLPFVYAGASLALAALAFYAWRKWRARSPEHVLLPHEIALARLEKAREWMRPDRAREFSIEVSGAVRFYIEDRFQARAARRTTEEFLHDLLADPSSSLAAHAAPLEDFLRHCDLAKFARWALSLEEMQSMFESARRFVEETIPREEAPVDPGYRMRPNGGPGKPPIRVEGRVAA